MPTVFHFNGKDFPLCESEAIKILAGFREKLVLMLISELKEGHVHGSYVYTDLLGTLARIKLGLLYDSKILQFEIQDDRIKKLRSKIAGKRRELYIRFGYNPNVSTLLPFERLFREVCGKIPYRWIDYLVLVIEKHLESRRSQLRGPASIEARRSGSIHKDMTGINCE